MHIALEVSADFLQHMKAKGEASDIETRAMSDHGFIDSKSFRDTNGYSIELAAKRPLHDAAHLVLGDWLNSKQVMRWIS